MTKRFTRCFLMLLSCTVIALGLFPFAAHADSGITT